MPFDFTACIETWRAQLLDTTKRNRLINFKSGGRAGGVALVHPATADLWSRLLAGNAGLTFVGREDLIDLPPDPEEASGSNAPVLYEPADQEAPPPAAERDILEQCLRSPRLRPGHILTDLPDRLLKGRLARLALNARESLTEQGVTILYVAFGFLRWFESPDSKVAIRSPLLLLPVRLARDNINAPWKLRADDEEVLPNYSLAQRLLQDFQMRLPLPSEDPPDGDATDGRLDYFRAVENVIRHGTGWAVQDEAALGTFNFQKLAMWEDLGRNSEHIKNHDLCRAVAGDPTVALSAPQDLPASDELDEQTRPMDTFHILDADSSQHEAILAATRGANLVLDGPPGTGKSQTIANMIAEALANGKTVLFVSEKAAALEVVQRRLQDHGLGDFVLACHSHRANKQAVVAELSRCLSLEPEGLRNMDDDLRRLFEDRRRLNQYVQELHAPRLPLGLTIYQVHGELAQLARHVSPSRCAVPQVLERDGAYLKQIVDVLAQLPDCRRVFEEGDRHPWRGCQAAVYSTTLREDVRHHFRLLAEGSGRLTKVAATYHQLGLGEDNPDWSQCRAALDRTRAILTCPTVPASWFSVDARATAEAVLRLDQATHTYRQRLAVLPEFVPESLRNVDPTSLAMNAGTRLVPHPGETLQSRLGRLAVIAKILRDLHQQATIVDQAAQRVAQLLQPPANTPVKALGQLAALANQVAGLKVVRKAWWDAGRRQELQVVAARARDEERLAQQARAALAVRLSPVAFAPENAALAARALRFRFFLWRLFPSWRALKADLRNWYMGQAPTTADLFQDLERLADYHRRVHYGRQVREQYAADLLTSAEGQPAWEETLQALESVDGLERLGKVPALQRTLSEEGALDRQALVAAARALEQQTTALRQQLEAVAQDYNLAEVTAGAPQHVQLNAADLAAWVDRQVLAVESQANTLQRWTPLVREGRDLAVDVLPVRLLTLVELAKLRAQITLLVPRIWPSQPPQGVEERDWSDLRATAEALLRFLNGWQAPLSPAVVRALTLPDVRSQLAEAARQQETIHEGIAEAWQFLGELFPLTDQVSTGLTLERTPLPLLRQWLTERADDVHRIQEWVRIGEVQRALDQAGVGAVLEAVHSGRLQPEDAAEAFRARFLGLWLDAVYQQAPALREFTTDKHQRLIGEFRELDRRCLASNSSRIRAFQLNRPDRPRARAADVPGSSELGTVLREANKKRHHLALRKLFAAIPTLLPRLKPCLMMSPLAVSTYLDAPDLRFDLVIFDEASQVRPHDAICAIYRGRQLIVAGDQKQLPPTSFFARTVDGDSTADAEDGGAGLEDYESILDVLCTLGLARRRLRWHYRSRREGLIAFANHHIYANELVTFPSVHDVAGNPAVTFDLVADGRWKPGASGGFNAVEARRTAERVLTHFRDHPDQSLGVIAFSQRQQHRIQDELDQLRQANPDLESFFDEERDEPFFVKNLENVQGDERDVIFLGIGYGPDETGRIAMRFGPLNQQGGERRLNVAVTRARQRLAVVSSLRAHDIDLSKSNAVGVKLLRAFLDYAERGPAALPGALTGVDGGDFDSPFEREVCDELTRRGMTLHRQIGCSGFRIDLAVVDPRTPGRYLLGIECDGATYHSSATARDRDRLRQQVLEGLGWRICRIWSTDWLRDREGQVGRVVAALGKTSPEEPAPPRDRPPSIAPADLIKPAPVPDTTAADYESIDDVPLPVLREVSCRLLRTFGATATGELILAVARQLGFKRTGKRIQARMEECLEGLLQEGAVGRTADQRLQVAPPVRAVSG